MSKENNQSIKCTVFDCRYNDTEKNICELNSIKVANCDLNNSKEATMCDSFKSR